VRGEVPHQVDWVWSNWADLEAMPQWMRWIQSVELPPDQPHVSIWHLGANGFTFAWKSRITKQVPLQMIQWESVDGLPNRGAVRFYGRGETTILKLSVAYSIPGGDRSDNGLLIFGTVSRKQSAQQPREFCQIFRTAQTS
jgi:Predicted integral membrane protein